MNFVTPISHLFEKEKDSIDIMQNSDYLEARERTCTLRFPNTTHYHIDFDLNLGLSDKQIDFLQKHVRDRDYITHLTFQASKDCREIIFKDGIAHPVSKIVPLKKQIENTKLSIKKIKNIVGTNRFIGIENNNYLAPSVHDISTSLTYLLEVLESNDIHLLFDIAHALVTCANKSYKFESYTNKLLSTRKCLQIHLCQPTYEYNSYGIKASDSHEIPTVELTDLTLDLAKKWKIKNITVEYYKNADTLVAYLRYLRSRIKRIDNE